MDRNDLPLDQCHLEVPSSLPKKISILVEHSAQTDFHARGTFGINRALSYTELKQISKRIKMNLTHVT
jgi:hypothetical protein